MEENICCTIVNPSHIHKGITMLMSLNIHNDSALLYLFVTEPVNVDVHNINIIDINEITAYDEEAKFITQVYVNNMDGLRWTFKSVIMRYLLNKHQNSRVIYCDSDMCFFDNPTHLFDYVDQGGVVITPYWAPLSPASSVHMFRLNFVYGMFNAGCVVANSKGIHALEWWTKVCISGMEHDPVKGLMLDQRYLELMLVYFPETIICRHFGYNVGSWNIEIRNEYLYGPKKLKDLFPIILVHFDVATIPVIENGDDRLLEKYYGKYLEYLEITKKMLADDDKDIIKVQ